MINANKHELINMKLTLKACNTYFKCIIGVMSKRSTMFGREHKFVFYHISDTSSFTSGRESTGWNATHAIPSWINADERLV